MKYINFSCGNGMFLLKQSSYLVMRKVTIIFLILLVSCASQKVSPPEKKPVAFEEIPTAHGSFHFSMFAVDGKLAYRAHENSQDFIVIDGVAGKKYDTIHDNSIMLIPDWPIDVNGTLVFAAGKLIGKDNYGFPKYDDVIVFDGTELDVNGSVEGLIAVNGKLAYVLVHNGVRKVILDGKELENSMRCCLTTIGGKIAYVSGPPEHSYVVIDDKKASDEYLIYNIYDVGGKLAFTADKDGKSWVLVYDGKEVEEGPYYTSDHKSLQAPLPRDVGGKLTYGISTPQGAHIVFGDKIIRGRVHPDDIRSIGNKLAYSADENGKLFVVFDGIPQKKYYNIWEIADIGGKLAYIAAGTPAGMRDVLVYDGVEYKLPYFEIERLKDIGGKLAFNARKSPEDTTYTVVMESDSSVGVDR